MVARQWNGRDWTGFEPELRILRDCAMRYRDEDQALDDNVAFPLENTVRAYKGEEGMSSQDMEAGVALGDLMELHQQLCFEYGFDTLFVRDAYSRILDPNEIPRWRGASARRQNERVIRLPAATRNHLRAGHARRNVVYREAVRCEVEIDMED